MRATNDQYGINYNRGTKTKHEHIITSLDGCTAYLLITDAYTRYTWVFPTKDKPPPLSVTRHIIQTFGRQSGYRAIRVDQGGELARSHEFCNMVTECKYSLKPTGSGCAWMNGKVERLNHTFGVMVRSLLYSSGLSPKFWAKALAHAVYIKNRIWHSAVQTVPYELQFGVKPDLSHLRVFGSRVTITKPGKAPAKLDNHTYDGVFVGHTATPAIHEFYDNCTEQFKTAGNIIFDEAHFTSTDRPPGPQLLFDLGFHQLQTKSPAIAIPTTAVYPQTVIKRPSMPPEPFRIPLPLGNLCPTNYLHASAASCQTTNSADIIPIEMSDDPFEPTFHQDVTLNGVDSTLGFDFIYDQPRH